MAQTILRWVAILLAAITLAAASGCSRVSSKEAAQFNAALVQSQKRLNDAGQEFGKSAGAAIGGGVIEVAMLDRALEKTSEEMARVKSDVKTMRVPNSAAARNFHAAFTTMLETEEKLLAEELGAIVRTLKDPSRPAAAKHKRVMLIANYLTKMEADAMASVKEAQAAFAKEHGVKLR
ncbi:MAG: hypothetical protein EXR31_05780 [Betaproteobacteria bacterium]|nr:hypothetical protein [Betaproteobacteria bacterium]